MARDPLTRAEVLDLLHANRATLLDTLERRGWDRPDASGWTGKDHLAHAAAWSRRLAREFEAGLAGAVVHWPEEGYTLDQIDDLNERDWLADRDRTLEDVRADFDTAHAAVVRMVEQLDDDDLNDSSRFDWLPVAATVALDANVYGHYLDHARMVDGG